MSEVNKGAVGLIVVLLLGAAGYLWFQQLYKPAVEKRTSALAAATTADSELQKAKSDLAAAQQQAEEAKKEASKPDKSVAEVQVGTKAIPQKPLIDDAAIVLMDLADQAGISTNFSSGDDSNASADLAEDATSQGATPIDLTFKAAGTYQEMMLFMSLAEGTVTAKGGKLYAKDRLFNVQSLQIGGSGDDNGTDAGLIGGDGDGEEATGLVIKPGDMVFTVTIRMYTSSTANAEGVGASTPDGVAASPTDGSTGDAGAADTANSSGDDGAATGSDGAAAGANGGNVNGAQTPATAGAGTNTSTPPMGGDA